MRELINKRTLNTKHYDLGEGRYRLIANQSAIHYVDSVGKLQDIDLTPIDKGDHFEITKTAYKLKVYKTKIEADYTSRIQGNMIMSLLAVGGRTDFNISPRVDGDKIYYDNVFPGVDIYLRLFANGVEWFKVLKTPTAPKTFEWRVDQSKDHATVSKNKTKGADSAHNKIEAITTISDPVIIEDREIRTITEEFTGRVSEIFNEVTRQRRWIDTPIYPVLIDAPDISEIVSAGTDDGAGYNIGGASYVHTTHFSNTLANIGVLNAPGSTGQLYVRFQTIGLDQAAAITSAKLKGKIKDINNTFNVPIKGHDIDDAVAPTNRAQLLSFPRTTAGVSASMTTSATGATPIWSVTNIIQEIVDRTGWLNNNDMQFFGDVPSASGYVLFHAYEATVTGATISGAAHPGMVLEIDYINEAVDLTGTAIAGGVLESEIVAGGETIIYTLTGDTWVATIGDDNGITTAFLAGLTGDDAGANGWDNEITLVHGNLVRTSDTVLTLTLPSASGYRIITDETLTHVIPASAFLTRNITLTPDTILITNEVGGAFQTHLAVGHGVFI